MIRLARCAPALLALAGAPLVAAEPPAPAPRLILLLVVDQGRADYFDRYRPLFTGGLARLIDESVRFLRAFHDHAIPKTGPGHATLASGTHPRRHGIIANSWIERETGEEVEAAGDPDFGESPRRLLVPTLGDWLKTAAPSAKVYGVSEKARSANLLAGRGADGAFWLDEDSGRFTGSAYYPDSDPSTLGLAADRLTIDRFFGRLWEPLDAEALARVPDLAPMDWGYVHRGFPHSFGDATLCPDEDYYEAVADSPWIDEMTVDVAEAVLSSRGLGDDDVVDLLAVSFSAVDGVGHHYGPDSPELVDTLLRLDRQIARLLETVDREVGLARTIVTLSADHGVPPVPGSRVARGLPAARLYGEEVACFQRAGGRLVERFGEAARPRPGPFFDGEALARAGSSSELVERAAAELLADCPWVRRVWTRAELAVGADTPALEQRLFEHSFHRERSPDLLVQLEPYAIAWTSWETTHSSLYEYDRHVPWLLRLPGAPALEIHQEVATVDLAPTLADLAGVAATGPVDGVSRRSLLTIPTAEREESP